MKNDVCGRRQFSELVHLVDWLLRQFFVLT